MRFKIIAFSGMLDVGVGLIMLVLDRLKKTSLSLFRIEGDKILIFKFS